MPHNTHNSPNLFVSDVFYFKEMPIMKSRCVKIKQQQNKTHKNEYKKYKNNKTIKKYKKNKL